MTRSFRRGRSRSRSRRRNRSRFPASAPIMQCFPIQQRLAIGGLRRVVEVLKDNTLLGITVSDGPNDMTCVRRIASNSTCSRMQDGIRVGDRIESINGESMLGKRHITVASLLRRIPIGQIIIFGLVSEEEVVPFDQPTVVPLDQPMMVPLDQPTVVPSDQPIDVMQEDTEGSLRKKVINAINKVFEEYLGIVDDDLALSVWGLVYESSNLLDMSRKIRESAELSQFEFPEEVIFDMWGVLDDFKQGRFNKGN